MQNQIDLGADAAGKSVTLDVEELLATRLLVQGNSGSGKSHLLRRLLEKSAGIVQQIVIDPEGDFVSLAEAFGHVVIDGAAYSDTEVARLAARAREHRASVVLALDGLELGEAVPHALLRVARSVRHREARIFLFYQAVCAAMADNKLVDDQRLRVDHRRLVAPHPHPGRQQLRVALGGGRPDPARPPRPRPRRRRA